MYSFSLLVNSFSLEYLVTVMKNIATVTESSHITAQVISSYEWILGEIKHLTPDSYEPDSDADNHALSPLDLDTINCDGQNPFLSYVKKHLPASTDCQTSTDKIKNQLKTPHFIDKIMALWIPTCPFWTGLLLGKRAKQLPITFYMYSAITLHIQVT